MDRDLDDDIERGGGLSQRRAHNRCSTLAVMRLLGLVIAIGVGMSLVLALSVPMASSSPRRTASIRASTPSRTSPPTHRPKSAHELLDERNRQRATLRPSATPAVIVVDDANVVINHDHGCTHSVVSPDLIVDDRGRVCARPNDRGCCSALADADVGECRPRHVCTDSETGEHCHTCCRHYEWCVAVCMHELRPSAHTSAYRTCSYVCRSSSMSLATPSARLLNEYAHCFSSERIISWSARRTLSNACWLWTPHGERRECPLREITVDRNQTTAAATTIRHPRLVRL